MMEGKINASELNKAEKLYQPKHKTQRAILGREGVEESFLDLLFGLLILMGLGEVVRKISLPLCDAETKHCVA